MMTEGRCLSRMARELYEFSIYGGGGGIMSACAEWYAVHLNTLALIREVVCLDVEDNRSHKDWILNGEAHH